MKKYASRSLPATQHKRKRHVRGEVDLSSAGLEKSARLGYEDYGKIVFCSIQNDSVQVPAAAAVAGLFVLEPFVVLFR